MLDNTALAQTLGEARASAICRSDAVRSLVSLFACGASRALANDWVVALVAAAVTCTLCVMTIPLWPHIGLGNAGYQALRLALIGLALGCIRRASTLSCFFLSLLIGISDWTIGAHETGSGWHVLAEKHNYLLVLHDGIIMASMLILLQTVRLIRIFSSRSG